MDTILQKETESSSPNLNPRYVAILGQTLLFEIPERDTERESRFFKKKCIFAKTTGMRKAVGFLFLLLANLNLLAHAAIPHHHHDRIPIALFATEDLHRHCHEDKSDNQEREKHHSLPVETTHTRTGDSNLFIDCLLSQAYLQTKQQSQPGPTVWEQLIPDIVAFPVCDTLTDIQPKGNKPFRFKPFQESCHALWVRTSIGLRAPPVC